MRQWKYIEFQLWSLLILTCGCTVLAPVTDRSRFYILASDVALPARTSVGRTNLTIGVGPVYIPQYLQRTGIATRVGTTRIEYSSTDRWAEPLNESFPRILAQDLANALGTDRVVLFPWNRSSGVNYQVQVNVDKFDLIPSSDAELKARWFIKDVTTGRILTFDVTNQIQPAGSDGASRTEALSKTLSRLSAEIALKLHHVAEGS